MMQLGFVSAILPEADLEQVLATAAAYDYDCVEVVCWPAKGPTQKYGGTAHIDVANINTAYLAEINRLIDQIKPVS